MSGINFIVKLHLYPYEVMVSIGESDTVLEKSLKKYGIKDDERLFEFKDQASGRAVIYSGGQTLIRLPKWPTTPHEKGTLAHEIFHVVYFIFRRINIKLCIKSDEAFAYAIGYLTQEIYKRKTKN